MKTSLDCFPCFMKQAERTARVLDVNEHDLKEIKDKLNSLLSTFDMKLSPPVMGEKLYSMIAEEAGVNDPYHPIKRESNAFALKLYPRLKEKIEKSDDRLFTAVQLAIIGNMIDYGAVSPRDVNDEINAFLEDEHDEPFNADIDFSGFREFMNRSDSVLYIGDNAGEIVFDKLLVEELLHLGKKVTFAVRGKPAINDALPEDAQMTGITGFVPVITNGNAIPGTVLDQCSAEFVSAFFKADMVISKGQGNFETLSEEKGHEKIFFLFRVKCPVVAAYTSEPEGTLVLKRFKSIQS